MNKQIVINPSDNVAVLLEDTAIAPRGHKITLRAIHKGEHVIKYGHSIGYATQDIAAGEWVHSHNMRTGLDSNLSYSYAPQSIPATSSDDCPCIDAYLRSDGSVGIRNELWIVPTVGCVNTQAEEIARQLRDECTLPNVDDIRAYTHNYGCSQLGADLANTREALAALIKHPNAGGVIVLALGCENNKADALKESLGNYDKSRIRFIVAQEVEDEVAEGIATGRQLLSIMKDDCRQKLPLSKLKVGLKCGGSDGLSGITANPLVGRVADRLVACGGTAILTEVPEMFGAETILMKRAANREVFDRIVAMINGFKDYFRANDQPVYENPSPGNKDGGITTLEEKSLGCVQKGGRSAVTDVLDYAQQSTVGGLNLLYAPGNDLVAASALALSGCQIVLFTTGRGTPFGTFVPTLKISTNTELANRKKNWIDFDAGPIASGTSIESMADELLQKIIAVASGAPTRNESSHSKGLAMFKTGVTL